MYSGCLFPVSSLLSLANAAVKHHYPINMKKPKHLQTWSNHPTTCNKKHPNFKQACMYLYMHIHTSFTQPATSSSNFSSQPLPTHLRISGLLRVNKTFDIFLQLLLTKPPPKKGNDKTRRCVAGRLINESKTANTMVVFSFSCLLGSLRMNL